MAKFKKKRASKPDIVMQFASPEQAALFCYALQRNFPEEFSEGSSKMKANNSGNQVEIFSPVCHFDKIKEISCDPQFGRTVCSQHTASR